jgi:hypothetical protein
VSLEEDIPSITAATGNDIGPYGDQDDEQVKKFRKDKLGTRYTKHPYVFFFFNRKTVTLLYEELLIPDS